MFPPSDRMRLLRWGPQPAKLLSRSPTEVGVITRDLPSDMAPTPQPARPVRHPPQPRTGRPAVERASPVGTDRCSGRPARVLEQLHGASPPLCGHGSIELGSVPT